MIICSNKKALHDYFVEDHLEAGVVLEGWEVKAIRLGKAQLRDSYVKIKSGEVWLLGCQISPLISASTHVHPDNERTRKLLLSKQQINRLIGKVDLKGYSIVVLNLHFTKGRVKAEIALARGKKQYDKRMVARERELAREKQQIIKEYKTR